MHVYFSVGEPSGDAHAAKLIDEIRRRDPQARFSGYGGPRMADAGCELQFELTQMAVMGIAAVLPLLLKFYRLVKQAEQYLIRERPDAVVLVDFPGFNWWIARKAKRLGIPVFYYMPPQLWAWASWRIRRVRRFVDYVLSPLQFETRWYRDRGVDAQFVGHPFFDEVAEHQLDPQFMSAQREQPGAVIGVLPGSRNQEVLRNWPIQLATIRRVHDRCPETRFLVACYNQRHLDWCRSILTAEGTDLPVELCVHRTPEIIAAADACLIVSGSVSLEVLARHTPAVVLYACSRPLYLFGRMFVRCAYFTLANLIAGREVMPEFPVVGDPSADIERMAGILESWLMHPALRQQVSTELAALAASAAQPGSTARAADAILSRLAAAQASPESERRAA